MACARVPLRGLHFIGRLAGRILYWLPNRARSVARTNIELCLPTLNPQARSRLLCLSLQESCKTLFEFGPFWRWETKRLLALVRETDGLDALQQAFDTGQGVLIVTPHLGAWEMCGVYGGAHFPLNSLYRVPRLKGVEDWQRAGRERSGSKLFRTDRSGIRSLMHALGNGEMVGILPDQVPPRDAGIYVPFFNRPAYTMTLFTSLAQKFNPPAFIAYMKRLPRAEGYKMIIKQLPKEVGDMDTLLAATILNQAIEDLVRECPEQYLWVYRRFKRPPPGTPDVY